FSTPAEISTITPTLLITDHGNNQVLRLDEGSGLINWLVQGISGNPAIFPPSSGSQNNSVDHIDFGDVLSADGQGVERIDTTMFTAGFPGYAGSGSPSLLSGTDPRVKLFYSTLANSL